MLVINGMRKLHPEVEKENIENNQQNSFYKKVLLQAANTLHKDKSSYLSIEVSNSFNLSLQNVGRR
jgi:hypothetical protein